MNNQYKPNINELKKNVDSNHQELHWLIKELEDYQNILFYEIEHACIDFAEEIIAIENYSTDNLKRYTAKADQYISKMDVFFENYICALKDAIIEFNTHKETVDVFRVLNDMFLELYNQFIKYKTTLMSLIIKGEKK
jgi:hypothetical protein